MKKPIIFYIFTFAFCIFTPNNRGGLFNSASAQSPQGTSYQAVIRNSSGVLVSNRTISLRFSIHDSAAAGPVVYQETQNPVTNAQGLVNINVGLGTPVSGTFSIVNWGNKRKFLQVELDANGGTSYTDMGTTQMMSVPYALYANNGMPTAVNKGDILYWNGTSWTVLPAGGFGKTLTICDGSLSWGGCPPALTTSAVSAITSTTANCGGNITQAGLTAVTARGVCWSTSANPTIALATKTVNGTGTGTFTSSITGLTANTTYYVRAYATNSVGTSYGTQVSFTTTSSVVNLPSVTIGTQIWGSKNLDVATYKNGDPIPQVTDPIAWSNLTTGAWCWYNNDSANYAATYGRLYNWYAVNDSRGLAPAGWHVPNEAEWNKLVKYIDAGADTVCQGCYQSTTAGGAMKSTTGWISPNTGATNSSGFAGLPGGYRDNVGPFFNVGSGGVWWSASEYDTTGAWNRGLVYNYSYVHRYSLSKTLGFSVRVVRD